MPRADDAVNMDTIHGRTEAEMMVRMQKDLEAHYHQLRRLIVASQSRRFQVHQVHVEGVRHTRPELIGKLISPLLPPSSASSSESGSIHANGVALGDLIDRTQAVTSRMARLGIFKGIQVEFDDAALGRKGQDAVNVIITVKESPRLWAQTGTDVGNNEAAASTRVRLRNILGNAETLEAHVAYGLDAKPLQDEIPSSSSSSTTNPSTTSSSASLATPLSQAYTTFGVQFSRPVNADPDHRFELHGQKLTKNLALYSSHAERITGFGAKYKILNTLYGSHVIGYDVAWRQVTGLSRDASYSVRRDAGHSLKSALSYTVMVDKRNDPLLPTKGHYVKGFAELAGLGGDVLHAKGELEGQYHQPLRMGFSAAASARGGILFPLAHDKPNRINDRFFLGGPLSIRGFTQHGVGPLDGVDRVGGDLFVSGGVSLLTPLPYLVDAPIKGHIFANAGNLIQMDHDKPIEDSFKRLFSTVTSSIGLGIAIRFSALRFELNYCLPVTMTTTDSLKSGIQFGIGFDYS